MGIEIDSNMADLRIETTGDNAIWRNYYFNFIDNNGGFREFIKLDRKIRIVMINSDLKQYHAYLNKISHLGFLEFESEEYKTMFILRWS